MFLRKDRSEGKFPPAIIVVAHQFSIYNTHFNLSLLYKSKCRQETHDLKIWTILWEFQKEPAHKGAEQTHLKSSSGYSKITRKPGMIGHQKVFDHTLTLLLWSSRVSNWYYVKYYTRLDSLWEKQRVFCNITYCSKTKVHTLKDKIYKVIFHQVEIFSRRLWKKICSV